MTGIAIGAANGATAGAPPPPPPPPSFSLFGYGATVSETGPSGTFSGPYVVPSNGVNPITYNWARIGGSAKLDVSNGTGANCIVSYSGFGVGDGILLLFGRGCHRRHRRRLRIARHPDEDELMDPAAIQTILGSIPGGGIAALAIYFALRKDNQANALADKLAELGKAQAVSNTQVSSSIDALREAIKQGTRQ